MLTVASRMTRRDAWKSVEGTSTDDAQEKYVEKLLEVRTPQPPTYFPDRRVSQRALALAPPTSIPTDRDVAVVVRARRCGID